MTKQEYNNSLNSIDPFRLHPDFVRESLTSLEPLGRRERIAEYFGFSVTFDCQILGPNGLPVSFRKTGGGYPIFQVQGLVEVFGVMAHRFVFHCLVGPIDPKKVIDHIDRNKANFHISNLREVTQSENRHNIDKAKRYGKKTR